MGSLYSRLKKETATKKLGFGVHENVVIRDIFTGKKRKENNSGDYYPQEIFLTFTKLNEKNEAIEEKEFSFWKFDPFFSTYQTSERDITQKVKTQLDVYYQILYCYYPFDAVEKIFDPTSIVGITDQTSNEEIISILKQKQNLDKINKYIQEAFKKAITPLMGLNSKYRFRLKVAYDKKGYLNLGFNEFIESMKIPKEASKLNDFTITELKYKNNAESSVNADSSPKPISGQPGAPLPPVPGMSNMETPGVPSAMPDLNKTTPDNPGNVVVNNQPTDMQIGVPDVSKTPENQAPELMSDPFSVPGLNDDPNF